MKNDPAYFDKETLDLLDEVEEEMRRCIVLSSSDPEAAHSKADELLVATLNLLGCPQRILRAYSDVERICS